MDNFYEGLLSTLVVIYVVTYLVARFLDCGECVAGAISIPLAVLIGLVVALLAATTLLDGLLAVLCALPLIPLAVVTTLYLHYRLWT
jgi:hypothetical protein